MIDLIGFWVVLTIIIYPILICVIAALLATYLTFTYHVTGSLDPFRRLVEVIPESIRSKIDNLGSFVIHIFLVGLSIFGVMASIYRFDSTYDVYISRVISGYSNFAQSLASFAGWVVVILVLYWSAVKVGRIGYALKSQVEEIKKQVNKD